MSNDFQGNISFVKIGDWVLFGKVNNLNTSVNLDTYKIEENIDLIEDYNEEKFIQYFFDLLKEKGKWNKDQEFYAVKIIKK